MSASRVRAKLTRVGPIDERFLENPRDALRNVVKPFVDRARVLVSHSVRTEW